MIRKPLLACAALAFLSVSSMVNAQAGDDRQAVQDVRGGVVHNTFGNCVRTKWMTDGDICRDAPPPPPKVAYVAPPPPAPLPVVHTVISEADRTVYFPFNKASLTEQSKAQLDTLASTLKSAKDIQEAHVVGTADRIGSVGYNDKLSEKRAIAVRDYLVARGYTNASVTKTRWVGKSEPITNCSKKLPHKQLVSCLQNDRRVKIDIVYRSEVVTQAPAQSNYYPASGSVPYAPAPASPSVPMPSR